ncbi:SDR family oxidoreductase [Lewinella sp. W8]|uniref:SDR family oxidoreductase n=1 Tax=Lewinella sp. W8 TaxID=2528208 RepID=UPI001067DAFC|nr:SDR family oxidoreductase [Lewinella sp. W8]MTB50484.1 SDR family NAD(P)-dependent oxidoreductase [Lewinella sp. W8]
MLSIGLAYSSDDQSTAHRIAGDLADTVSFEHFAVGRANEGPILAELTKSFTPPMVVLISDHFLTNPNCMLRGHELFGANREVLPVIIPAHRLNEESGEVETINTSLANQSDVMHYVNHWQDRYIDLRRDADAMTEVAGSSFQTYLRKIREASTQAEELLHLIKDSWSLSEQQFSGNHYHQLFIFADDLEAWETHKTLEEAPPVDLTGIPGLEMLSPTKEVPPVEEETIEEDSEPTLPPMVEEVVPEKIPEEPPTTLPLPESSDQEPVTSSEEEIQGWITRAWAMADAGNFEVGADLLAAGLASNPDHLQLRYNYALLLASGGGTAEDALLETEKILDRSPDYPDALFLSGELHESLGNRQRTRDHWEQLSDVVAHYPDLNYRLGVLLADHFPEEYLDAAAYLRRAVKEEEVNGDAHYQYAKLLAGPVNRRKKAVKQFRQAIKLTPGHAPAHYELAVLLFDLQEYDEARKYYRLACSLDSTYHTPANQRAFFATPMEISSAAGKLDALAALKENIAQLESALLERQEEELAAQAQPGPGDGITVLISGATSGIGRATARRLAADGYRIIALGRRMDRLEELQQELTEAEGTDMHLLQLDVRNREAIKTAVADLPEDWQDIDILINNAGKAKGFDPIHTGNYEHWEEMIDVNLKGLLYLTREVSPGMVARGKGMIINVASTAGKEVYPNGNVYCATKHAVDALTYAMRLDLVKHGIRVGQICPAHVEETEFAVVRFDGDSERAKIYEDFQPLRSRDVAEALHFMISQPPHVNVMDMVIQGTQQASSTVVDRSGRDKFAPEEE